MDVSLAHKVVTPNIIMWDLETVPDLAGFAAANDLVGKSDDEIRETMLEPIATIFAAQRGSTGRYGPVG
jgi:hypothetical protein